MSDDNCGCSEPTPTEAPQVLDSVTECNDGALSGSHGQGSCSHHGGVSK